MPRQAIDPSLIGVGLRDGHYRVIALEPIAVRMPLLELSGVYVTEPTRYSVQVSSEFHVAPPESLMPDQVPHRYVWRYLNHSCRPSAFFEGRRLYSSRALQPWEEITFDYNTTELNISSPFHCRCGQCGGRMIGGYAALDARERMALADRVAAHLQDATRAEP